MTRLFAAIAAIALTLLVANAQERPNLGRLNPNPIEVIAKDGKISWKVEGRGEVRIEELMSLFADATNSLVSYSEAGVQRGAASYTAPDQGYTIASDAIPMFVSDLLSSGGRWTVVGFTEGRTRVIGIEEAHAYARYVDEAALKTINDAEWVLVRLPFDRMDSRVAVQNALEATLGNNRGQIRMQMVGSVLVISGRVDRVRRLYQLARDLDQSGAASQQEFGVKAFDVPSGLKAADIVSAIGVHFPQRNTQIIRENGAVINETTMPRVTATASSNGAKVIVKGMQVDLNIVESLITAMK
ncbi:MAG: hypothetical protein IT462_00420 [Planctomycetes bacterium]|nr:hypothetical protein [Planctomycetota bacterium]